MSEKYFQIICEVSKIDVYLVKAENADEAKELAMSGEYEDSYTISEDSPDINDMEASITTMKKYLANKEVDSI